MTVARRVGWFLALAALLPGLGVEAGDDDGESAIAAAQEVLPALLPFGMERLVGWSAADRVDASWREAVDRGLRWLAAHQSSSGQWEAATFGRWCDGQLVNHSSTGPGSPAHDVGVTGMALAAFLGAGRQPGSGEPYGPVVTRGLEYLKRVQAESGSYADSRTGERWLYDHAWATLAVVEAAGLTGDAALLRSGRRAVRLILQARNPYFAWRYGERPGENDTSVTTTMAKPLHAAQAIDEALARCGRKAVFQGDIPEAWDGIRAWVDKMTDLGTGRTGYIQRGGGPSRYPEVHGPAAEQFPRDKSERPTAAALLMRFWIGEKASSKVVKLGLGLLLATPPRWSAGGSIDLLYWYDGALVANMAGGKVWKAWRDALTDALVGHQHTDTTVSDVLGSWDPDGAWGKPGGRIYATALAVLTLETPLRVHGPVRLSRDVSRVLQTEEVGRAVRARMFAALERVDPETHDTLTAKALLGKEPDLLLLALDSLQTDSTVKDDVVERVARCAARGRDDGVRVAALEALGRLGPRSAVHAPVVTMALHDDSDVVSAAARDALAALAASVPEARRALESILVTGEPLERLRAAGDLLRADPSHARARSMLVAALDSENPEERAAAGRGLGTDVPAWAKVSKEQLLAAAKAGLPAAFENPMGMRFVLVPAGSFTMGSPEDEKGRLRDEAAHAVTLTKPYYLQVTEVTNAQWRGSEPDHESGFFGTVDLNDAQRPVLKVPHISAQNFADWVSAEDPHHRYRLPTEAEWEYAARAGTTTRYWWGDDEKVAGRYENVADLTAHKRFKRGFGQKVETTPGWRFFDTDDGETFTATVASHPPNPWGLYDVLGNASEWVADWRNPYPSGPVTDPRGEETGSTYVFRGGSWVASPHQARAAMRGLLAGPDQPGEPTLWVGLRLAAEPLPRR